MVEEGMYRHIFVWMYLLGGQRAFSRPLWAMARFLWTVIALFIGALVVIGLLAHVSPAAPRPAVVEVRAVVAVAAPTPVVRKVRTKAVARDTRCPGCSAEVVKVLR